MSRHYSTQPLPMMPKILPPNTMIAIVANAPNAETETNTAMGLVIGRETAREGTVAGNIDGTVTVTAMMT